MKRKTQKWKIGCGWNVFLQRMKGKHNNNLPPSKDLYHIKITTVGAKHTNGCEPGAKQYTLARTKAGEYAHATLQVLAQLVSHTILISTTVVDPNYI